MSLRHPVVILRECDGCDECACSVMSQHDSDESMCDEST